MEKSRDYETMESEVIGRGAYGTVYLGRRKVDGRKVIFKEIPMGQMTVEDRQTAMNEVQVHKMLPPHANIVEHFDYFIQEQALLIVMEYVEGGTLYTFLQNRGTSLLEEAEILNLFVQLVLALHHIHSKLILHRDIKTQNILLDKNHTILKLSDFGISKILASKSKAYSVVGTPCYISPELCESKPYNQKSDIWALGCVLYELCTLNRAFEAPNLPALVFKIMKGSYQHISDRYSPELRQLIRSLLDLDSNRRPNVSQILAQPIIIKVMYSCIVNIGAINGRAKLIEQADETGDEEKFVASDSSKNLSRNLDEPSKVSAVYCWGGKFELPRKLPLPSGITTVTDIACSRNQKFGLTKSGKILSWEQVETADYTVQLPGMSDAQFSTFIPRLLEGQGGVNVARICCGDLFAACVTDRGILMTFGSGSNGCLGHGNFHDVKQLKIVEALIGCEVMDFDCGANHMVALTTDQELFSWGIGDSGRLGLGHYNGANHPRAIDGQVFESNVVKISCGVDTSCFITRNNKIYVCGSNKENKLALDFLQNGEKFIVEEVCRPTRIKHEFFFEVTDSSVGNIHAAYVTATGDVILTGSNSTNQLASDFKMSPSRQVIKLDSNKKFEKVCCGDSFVIATTTQSQIMTWGRNNRGRLGRNEGNFSRPGPVAIQDLATCNSGKDTDAVNGTCSTGGEIVKVVCSHDCSLCLLNVPSCNIEHTSSARLG